MWLDCGNAFINSDKVDYICFEQLEQVWRASVCFTDGETLKFEHTDIKALKDHFRKVMSDGRKTEQVGP